MFTAEAVGCVDQMIKLFRRPKFADFTFIAHNAAGFDFYILLEYFTSQGLTPKIILQGCRLVYMYDQAFKQRYIDSYSSPSWELELRPLGVATGNALSVTRSEDTYVKTPPVGRRQPMTSLPACHNISAAGRIHHQLFRLH